jgi:hypothetical protein
MFPYSARVLHFEAAAAHPLGRYLVHSLRDCGHGEVLEFDWSHLQMGSDDLPIKCP